MHHPGLLTTAAAVSGTSLLRALVTFGVIAALSLGTLTATAVLVLRVLRDASVEQPLPMQVQP